MITRAAALLLLAATCRSASAEQYDFPQPRRAKVQIDDARLPWSAEVEFDAVRSFGPATNISLNRSKADFYLKLGLLRKMRAASKQTIALSGMRRTAEPSSGPGRYRAVFELAEPPVLQPASAGPPAVGEPPATDAVSTKKTAASDLLSRKDDVGETIDSLTRLLREQMPPVPDRQAGAAEKDAFFEKIADIEEKLTIQSEALSAEIKADNMLLEMEREQLLAKWIESNQKILYELSNYAKRVGP